MSISEIIELAYAEFGAFVDSATEFDIKPSSDDGGTLLEFFVNSPEDATILREKVPASYNGARTIIMYTNLDTDDGV